MQRFPWLYKARKHSMLSDSMNFYGWDVVTWLIEEIEVSVVDDGGGGGLKVDIAIFIDIICALS